MKLIQLGILLFFIAVIFVAARYEKVSAAAIKYDSYNEQAAGDSLTADFKNNNNRIIIEKGR